MKNWIYVTIFNEKFQNKYKEQPNNKVASNILAIIQGLILHMAVKSM